MFLLITQAISLEKEKGKTLLLNQLLSVHILIWFLMVVTMTVVLGLLGH